MPPAFAPLLKFPDRFAEQRKHVCLCALPSQDQLGEECLNHIELRMPVVLFCAGYTIRQNRHQPVLHRGRVIVSDFAQTGLDSELGEKASDHLILVE